MISDANVCYQWQTRHMQICVCGYYLEKKLVYYLIEVLKQLDINPMDCYLTDTTIVQRVLEYYDKQLSTADAAEKLKESNKVIGDNV